MILPSRAANCQRMRLVKNEECVDSNIYAAYGTCVYMYIPREKYMDIGTYSAMERDLKIKKGCIKPGLHTGSRQETKNIFPWDQKQFGTVSWDQL